MPHAHCIKNNLDLIHASDLIFINTISQSVHAYLPLKGKRVVLRIHNINKIFNPAQHLITPANWTDVTKLTKFLIKEILVQNYFKDLKKIKDLITVYSFPEPEMLKYALDNFQELTPNNTSILPLKIHTDSLSKKREDTSPDVNFSMIGSLNPYFKDVSLIEKVLFKLSNEKLDRKVNLYFVGCGNELKTMSKIKSYENEYLTFHFIEKRLSQKDYISHLKQMDCVICPMKHKFHVGAFVEFYGQTKITGNLSDVALSPTPMIMPSFYFKSKEPIPGVMMYENELDLVRWIKKLVQNPLFLADKKYEIEYTSNERYGLKTVTSHLHRLLEIIP
jgi:glycosyltransferase involved in cell wall biosynthesis